MHTLIDNLVQAAGETIEREKHYTITPAEMKRVWPDVPSSLMEETVRKFAEEHGWRLFNFNSSIGAFLVKQFTRSN